MGQKRVTVILSDEEYAQIRKDARLVPLSAWMRNLAISYSAGDSAERVTPPVGRQVKAVGTSRSIRVTADSDKAESLKPTELKPLEHPFVMPAKYLNHYCKEHHVMGCEYCAKRVLQGVPY